MKKKQTQDEYVQRSVRAIIFGDNSFARGIFGRLLKAANDNGADANAVLVSDSPRERNQRQFNRYDLVFKSGAQERSVDIDCITGVVDPFNDYDAFSALADNEEITAILWAPKRKDWYLENGRLKNEKQNFIAFLTMLLFRRFCLEMHGFQVISAVNEDKNGDTLKNEIVEYASLRNLGMDFISWLSMEVTFINTFIETRIGEETADARLRINAEKYFLFVFDKRDRLLYKSGLITVEPELSGYYLLRRHIYDGALCSSCAYALLHDVPTLSAFMFREKLKKHMTVSVFEEIIPALDLNFETVQSYAVEMFLRFEDESVTVKWSDYIQNLGYKVAYSLLPIIKKYYDINEAYPKHLVFSLFCTLKYYSVCGVQDEFSKKLKNSSTPLNDVLLWGEDISYLREELEAFEKKMG